MQANDRFGRLILLSPERIAGCKGWRVRCDCGTEKTIRQDLLKRGRARSCGCLHKELSAARLRTHGLTERNSAYDRSYRAWYRAKTRCTVPSTSNYHLYGGRGVTMCERWFSSVENFIADMGVPPPGYSLDRIDPHGNYEPGNCRWATSLQQARNRRDNVIVQFCGQPTLLCEVCANTGAPYGAMHYLCHGKGLRAEDALFRLGLKSREDIARRWEGQ